MRQNERTILLKKINVQSQKKYGPEKIPYLDTFHAVIDFIHSYCSDDYVADFNLLNAKVTITWKPFTWLALQINRLVSI